MPRLLLSVQNLADRDGAGGAGINDALVVLDRDKESFLIKYRPKFADEAVYLILKVHGQVGQIEGLAHNWLVDVRDEGGVEAWINGTIKVWSWVSELPQNDSSFNVVKEFIVGVRLVWESAVVEEWILHLLPALVSRGNTDRGGIRGACDCMIRLALARDWESGQNCEKESDVGGELTRDSVLG